MPEPAIRWNRRCGGYLCGTLSAQRSGMQEAGTPLSWRDSGILWPGGNHCSAGTGAQNHNLFHTRFPFLEFWRECYIVAIYVLRCSIFCQGFFSGYGSKNFPGEALCLFVRVAQEGRGGIFSERPGILISPQYSPVFILDFPVQKLNLEICPEYH